MNFGRNNTIDFLNECTINKRMSLVIDGMTRTSRLGATVIFEKRRQPLLSDRSCYIILQFLVHIFITEDSIFSYKNNLLQDLKWLNDQLTLFDNYIGQIITQYLSDCIMLVYVRHAERGDNQFPKQESEISYDPPITTDSQATISRTSAQLAQLFKANNITTVKIVSSKFLRCLMTAEQIGNKLANAGIKVSDPKIINNEIAEYLRPDWFKQYPLQQLIFHTPFLKKYISWQWKEDILEKPLPFPENYIKFHERIGTFKQKLQFPNPGEGLLIVTHGFVVRQLSWRMNQVPDFFAEIKYCGFAAFQHNGHQQILLRSKL